jgi:hypothetical protein
MIRIDSPKLQRELEARVLARTGRRVRNLEIELSDERVILSGQTATYHIKQLAQHGIRDVLPDVILENEIKVD